MNKVYLKDNQGCFRELGKVKGDVKINGEEIRGEEISLTYKNEISGSFTCDYVNIPLIQSLFAQQEYRKLLQNAVNRAYINWFNKEALR